MIATLAVLCLSLSSSSLRGGEEPKADPVRIECKAEAQVRGAEVQLRDLCDITAPDKALEQKLGSLTFGKRPAQGFLRFVQREEIERRVLETGLPGDRFTVTGPREIPLAPVFALLPVADILACADGAMRAAVGVDKPADIEFEAGATAPLQVPPGRRSCDLRASLRGSKLELAPAIVDVEVVVDDVVWKTLPISYRLHRFVDALVVDKAVQKGQPLSDENLTKKRVEIGGSAAGWIDSFDTVGGKVAARTLAANRPLLATDVTGPSVVWRGDVVSLVSESGHVKVVTKARVDQDGAVGAQILVTNLGSGRVLKAVVEGPGVASVLVR